MKKNADTKSCIIRARAPWHGCASTQPQSWVLAGREDRGQRRELPNRQRFGAMQPLTTDGTSDADDETIDVNAEFESGFDPDAYGGAAEGVGESAVLLDDADGSRIQRQRPGLRSMRLVAESREKTNAGPSVHPLSPCDRRAGRGTG